MSVIAKFTTGQPRRVPGGYLVAMSAVYDTDLSKPENENHRFTQATPGGDAIFETSHGFTAGEAYYLLFDSEAPVIPDRSYGVQCIKVRCRLIEDWGGTSKQIELMAAEDQSEIAAQVRLGREKNPPFNLKMTVDNPAASIWFYPGVEYWLRFYRASGMTLEQAVAMAVRKS